VALTALHGACRSGEPVDGDGHLKATVPLTCEQRPVNASITLDDPSGKVSELTFGKPEGATCPD
jgi:hypothetical protein